MGHHRGARRKDPPVIERRLILSIAMVLLTLSVVILASSLSMIHQPISRVTPTDQSTPTVIGTIPSGYHPIGIAYDPANNFLYVANEFSLNVTVINATSNSRVTTIQVGGNPNAVSPLGVAYDPLNNDIYVTNSQCDDVRVIDGSTNTWVSSITLSSGCRNIGFTPAAAEGIAYDPLNQMMYVASNGPGTVSIINATSNVLVTQIAIGHAKAVAFDELNGDIYVVSGYGYVDVIDQSNSITRTIPIIPNSSTGSVFSNPLGIAYNPSDDDVYVTDDNSGNITIINSFTNRIVTNVTLSLPCQCNSVPYGLAFDPLDNKMYVANPTSNQYDPNPRPVITLSPSHSLDDNITVGASPKGVVFDQTNGYIYVTNWISNTTSVISTGIPPLPHSELEASPQSQNIGLTGTASFSMLVIPGADLGPSSQVNLLVANLPHGLRCSFTDALTAFKSNNQNCSVSSFPEQTIRLFVYVSNDTAIGYSQFTVNATSVNVNLNLSLALSVNLIIGLQNLVSLSQLNIVQSAACPPGGQPKCTTFQQNFFVNVPGESSPTFWAQNVVLVGVDDLGNLHAAGGYDVYRSPNYSSPVCNNCPGNGSFQWAFSQISEQETFNLTSTVSGTDITFNVMGSPTAFRSTFRFPLPQSGSYVVLGGGNCSGIYQILGEYNPYCAQVPQLDTVGPGGGSTTFGPGTHSSMKSFVEQMGGQWSPNVIQAPVLSGERQTSEFAFNLTYALSGTNQASVDYQLDSLQQGLAFVPAFPSAVQASTAAVLHGGTLNVDQTKISGVSVDISNSSLQDGKVLAVTSTMLGSSQPIGTGALDVSSIGFYDVRVSNLLGSFDGIARICISNSGVSSNTLVEYYGPGIGWQKADMIVVTGDTVCGDVPLVYLNGTPIVVATPFVNNLGAGGGHILFL